MGPLSSTTDSDSTRSSAAPSPANPSANAQLNPVLHAQKILQQVGCVDNGSVVGWMIDIIYI